MKQKVVITIKNKYIDQLPEIESMLIKEGLIIDNSFKFGVITGRIEESQIRRLSTLPEFEAFKLDKEIQLPPSDAEIQ